MLNKFELHAAFHDKQQLIIIIIIIIIKWEEIRPIHHWLLDSSINPTLPSDWSRSCRPSPYCELSHYASLPGVIVAASKMAHFPARTASFRKTVVKE